MESNGMKKTGRGVGLGVGIKGQEGMERKGNVSAWIK